MYISMYKKRSIADARNNLPNIIRDAEAGETIQLTRRGEGVAVLVGAKEYERLVSGQPTFSAAFEAFLRDHDLDELDIDPDEVFGDVRDRTSGRDV